MFVLVRIFEQRAREVMRGKPAPAEPDSTYPGWRAAWVMNSASGLGCDLVGIDDHHLRRPRDQGHRDKILLDVVVEIRIERWRNGVMRRAHEESVVVRQRGLGGRPALTVLPYAACARAASC